MPYVLNQAVALPAGQDFGLATVHDFGPGTEQHKVPFVSAQSGGGPAKAAGESVGLVGGRPHFPP